MTLEELARNLPALFCALFAAVLFIQSGLDKVFDWAGNLEWLKGHFSETFLSPLVPLMLGTITGLEVLTGFLSAAGIVYFLATGSLGLIFIAALFGAASITALFFGQRVAKDYEGAAVLVPYFILMIIMLYLSNPYPGG